MHVRIPLLALGLLLALAPPLAAQDNPAPTPDQKLDAKIQDHRVDLGKEHLKLAKWCRRKKLERTAHVHWTLGLHFHPEDRIARRTLGYKKRDDEWVLTDPVDVGDLEDEERPPPEYQEKVDELRADRVQALLNLADDAKSMRLEARSRELKERAVRVDPYAETARKALEHVQIGGQWFTPDEANALSKEVAVEAANGISPIAQAMGLGVSRYQAGPFFVEGQGQPDEFRHILEAEARALDFLTRLHGREWLREGAQIGFLAVGDNDKFERYVDANIGDANQRLFAKRAGTTPFMNGAMVSPGLTEHLGSHADRMVHLVARHGMAANDSDPWLIQGFTDFVSGRIVGTMSLRFVKVESSGGGFGGGSKFAGSIWRQSLVKDVALGQDTRAEMLFSSSLNGLAARDIMKAWSLVTFLYERDDKKLMEFISGAEGGASADALDDIYGLTTEQIDEEWRAYVIEHF